MASTPGAAGTSSSQQSNRRASLSLSLDLGISSSIAPTLNERSPQVSFKTFQPGIRKKPVLTFGCPILPDGENVDVTIPLEKQG